MVFFILLSVNMYKFAGKINVYNYGVIVPIHRRFHDIQHMHHINFLNSKNFTSETHMPPWILDKGL